MIREVTKSQSHEITENTSPLTPLLKVEGNSDINRSKTSVKSVLNPCNPRNHKIEMEVK